MLMNSMQARAMVRRLLLTVMLLALPALANAAWQVSAKTSPSTAGMVSPTGTKTFADTVVSGTFTVTPNRGYKISSVTLAGMAVAPNAPGIDPVTGIGVYTIPKFAGVKTLIAYLVPGSASEYVVSTSVTGGSGMIRPAFTSPPPITALPRGGSYAFNIVPAFGYKVGDVLVDGVSVGAVSSYTFVNLTANHTISARFDVDVQVSASVATGGQMITGTPVTLTGTATTNDTGFSSYMFQVTDSSLSLVFSYSGTATVAFFTPAIAGDYTVNYTATSISGKTGSATNSFSVTSVKIQSVANCCACHAERDNAYVTAYKSSLHYRSTGTAAPACADCHNPGFARAHPGIYRPVDSCLAANCHLANDPLHTVDRGTYTCVTCHDPHRLVADEYSNNQPHYNNMTSAGLVYPASYKSSQTVCADCHVATADNVVKRREWELSGHATTTSPGWMALDFKTLPGCVQCHTTTGFKAYSTGKVTAAWGVASDKTKELLTCAGCHSNIATGALRMPTPVAPYADEANYLNPATGKSNICMGCHSGTKNGKSITAQLDALADFTNLTFIDPHYMAAAGVSYAKAGYHFPGRSYSPEAGHTKLGSLDASGPCVSCHKNSSYGHKFQSGAISLCTSCHGASLDDAKIGADRTAFLNALEVLRAQLAAQGFVYTAAPAAFSSKNWGAGQVGADTMGAAFNYALFATEPGAYAHNPVYARQLVLDSIDYLDNGQFDDSVATLAVPNLLDSQAISAAVADSMTSYKSKNYCTTCHGYPPAYAGGAPKANSHQPHDRYACNNCHAATTADGVTITSGGKHLNDAYDVTAGTGRTFFYSYASTGGSCSNISCHHNGSATWGSVLACDGCHDAPPATASHLKHYGGSVAQAAYGDTRIAQDFGAGGTTYVFGCGNCHPVDSARHMNGVVEVELYSAAAPDGSLKKLNPESALYTAGATVLTDSRDYPYSTGDCSNVYCHSYRTWTTTAAIPDNDPDWQAKVVTARNYRTVTWGGAHLGCSGCHGNPTQTSYPTNDGGAGDSHSWIDGFGGYQNLHTWNLGYAPISCSYCHNDTVKQLNSYTEDSLSVRTLSDVPISNFSKHVNGSNDVSFDKQNPFVYPTWSKGDVSMSLANASYDPVAKNCSNVSCHKAETTVKWGTPYRYWYESTECVRCHPGYY